MGIVTRADATRFAKITTALTADQATTLDDMIAAATPVIERYAGPVELTTRTFTTGPRYGSIVLPWRYVAVTSVTVDGLVIDPARYSTARAGNGILDATAGYMPWSRCTRVDIVAQVGGATVAPNVREAALELVAYWWASTQQSQRSAWQDGGATPMGFAVPARVVELLAPTPRLPGFG